MTPFEVLRIICGCTEMGMVEREFNIKICCAYLREATSTSKSPERISFVDATVLSLPVMAFSTRKGETFKKFSSFSMLSLMIKNVSELFTEDCPVKGGCLRGPMQGLKSDSGPDGTAHYGAQQGKAVTGEQSQPRHWPWCWPGPICPESSPGTLTTLNAKPQRMTLSLHP
ncbi:hypothetical protein AVEN_108278-1 [Araneus ventricosus]|uniref:Uncharacterized protein n=1 Tax=Araneus ventricosus TaxID=182803 RepID=A0A4Y2DWV8_ARAVE|nr:hypothetical protein AVEN_108278-1 [Araneus ventricosus]